MHAGAVGVVPEISDRLPRAPCGQIGALFQAFSLFGGELVLQGKVQVGEGVISLAVRATNLKESRRTHCYLAAEPVMNP